MPGVQTFPSQNEIDNVERSLKQELRKRAQNQLSEISNRNDVHVRDILPEADMDNDDSNNVNNWTNTNRQWVQSNNSADSVNQVYEVDASNRAEKKVIGFFAFSNIAGSPITSEIIFEDGTGSVFERAQVEEVFNRGEDTIALMEEPIIVNATEDVVIKQWTTAAGTDNVVYHGAVAEKKGNTLGERSVPQGSPVSGRSP